MAFSFAAVLSQKMIQEYEMKFKFGPGEVIKKLIEPESIFDIQDIVCERNLGSVYQRVRRVQRDQRDQRDQEWGSVFFLFTLFLISIFTNRDIKKKPV